MWPFSQSSITGIYHKSMARAPEWPLYMVSVRSENVRNKMHWKDVLVTVNYILYAQRNQTSTQKITIATRSILNLKFNPSNPTKAVYLKRYTLTELWFMAGCSVIKSKWTRIFAMLGLAVVTTIYSRWIGHALVLLIIYPMLWLKIRLWSGFDWCVLASTTQKLSRPVISQACFLMAVAFNSL